MYWASFISEYLFSRCSAVCTRFFLFAQRICFSQRGSNPGWIRHEFAQFLQSVPVFHRDVSTRFCNTNEKKSGNPKVLQIFQFFLAKLTFCSASVCLPDKGDVLETLFCFEFRATFICLPNSLVSFSEFYSSCWFLENDDLFVIILMFVRTAFIANRLS